MTARSPASLAERRALRLVLMCALYAAQGIPYGFVTVTLAAYLAGRGATAGEIGELTAITMLPWAFKWAWGPLVDRFSRSRMGRRRPWILGAQAMMVASASVLVFVPSLADDLSTLGWVTFAINLCASVQDVSVDALAVDLLPEHERGSASGVMYASSYLGMAFGGAGLSVVLGHHGLRAAMIGQIVALGAIMLLPLLLRERREDARFSLRAYPAAPGAPGTSTLALVRDLGRAFARRSPLVTAALALVALLGVNAIAATLTTLLVQRLGWSQEGVGAMMGGLPLLFGLVGSAAGGFIADRFGHRRVAGLAAALLGATWAGFGLVPTWWPSDAFVTGFYCAQELFTGALTATLFALFADVAWPRVAATQFTAFMALMNFGRTLGGKLVGPVEETFGVAGVFVGFGAAQLVAILLLLPIDPRQNRRELGET